MKILSENFPEFAFIILWNQDLAWIEVLKQFIYVFSIPLSSKKFTRRNIQKGNTNHFIGKINRRQKIIGFRM
ncbi:hypothetical protein D3C84_1036230 [compost metagenome]